MLRRTLITGGYVPLTTRESHAPRVKLVILGADETYEDNRNAAAETLGLAIMQSCQEKNFTVVTLSVNTERLDQQISKCCHKLRHLVNQAEETKRLAYLQYIQDMGITHKLINLTSDPLLRERAPRSYDSPEKTKLSERYDYVLVVTEQMRTTHIAAEIVAELKAAIGSTLVLVPLRDIHADRVAQKVRAALGQNESIDIILTYACSGYFAQLGTIARVNSHTADVGDNVQLTLSFTAPESAEAFAEHVTAPGKLELLGANTNRTCNII